MAFGLPNLSFIGYPVSIPCAGHAGLGFREATRADQPAILAHFQRLEPLDRRMRFCATVDGAALERHVTGIWGRGVLVLVAREGPLWSGPLYEAGPVRALAELAIGGAEAEIGLSVDAGFRRQGVGTYLMQTAARLLALRGVKRIRAYTLPDNNSFLALARKAGAQIETGAGEVEITFDVAELQRSYLRRRAAQAFLLAPEAVIRR